MFGLFRRSAPRPLSPAVRNAIEKDGMTPAVSNPSQLRMVELTGRYSDRKVTYFRVFDPTNPAQQTVATQRYKDFDIFPGLVLRSGHVERDGTVILTRPVGARTPAPVRTRAGRIVPDLDAAAVDGGTDPAGSTDTGEMNAARPAS
jgi:hypothetical protein